LLTIGVGLGGCAPVRLKTRKGVYHEVQTGETLWRICYAYQANMKTVCRFNRIKDPEHIAVGQEIFIPGAEKVLKVEPVVAKATPRDDSNAKEAAPSATRKKPSKATGSKPTRPRSSARPARLSFIWPVKGPVTSWFGPRKGRPHDGIDIAAPKGTPVLAAEKGKVIYSDDGISGYGNLVIIQHEGGFHSVYGHNARNRVDVDEVVTKRQVIAEVGNTGRASGYHLHFEIRKNQRAVDPMKYLP
jgi:lipoprotein NlpD